MSIIVNTKGIELKNFNVSDVSINDKLVPDRYDDTGSLLKQIKQMLTIETVIIILQSFGYSINKHNQFEDDTSLIVNKNGTIIQKGSVKNGFEFDDIIGFLQSYENMSFTDAVESIADILNISVDSDISFLSVDRQPLRKTTKPTKKEDNQLQEWYNKNKGNKIPPSLVYEIIDKTFITQCSNIKQVINKFMVYDDYFKKINICYIDKNNQVQSVSYKMDKWNYKKGSKASYIPYSIKDDNDPIFISVGQKEMIVSELLKLNYICLGSDSIVKTLDTNEQFNSEIKPLLNKRVIIYIVENDTSSRDTVPALRELISSNNIFIAIDNVDLFFNHHLRNFGDRHIPLKGSDFIDYINFIKNKDEVLKTLEDIIKGRLRNIRVNGGLK